MIHEELASLAEKIALGTATDTDINRYHELLDTLEQDEQWNVEQMGTPAEIDAILKDRIYESTGIARRKTKIRLLRIGAAATVALLMTVGALSYWNHKKDSTTKTLARQSTRDKKDKAVLKLADGREIELNDDNNTLTQGNDSIHLSGGLVVSQNNGEADNQINELVTPAGSQFLMVLQDGTKVWLNTGSKLRFPNTFHSLERSVELIGEAYFEVAPHTEKPFVVHSGDKSVKVLGTSFNINAYTDEPRTNVTLMDGAVKVYQQNDSLLLKPGQQAKMATDKGIEFVSHADTDHVMAWKNGYFSLNGESTPVIIRQIARWHNLEVVYAGNVPDLKFAGNIKKSYELADVLAILTESGIHTKVDKNKLIVYPE
ncbi:MAG: FecR domain-containing protein [Chitinophaga sp.]|uniref:FecR family protein n=1 Tax=Chitinophaga sp. TaxID=1869181 RepID=UPI0025C19CB1|nr:FecR family protein [Chitinophaga sp.]MBV8253900.1 FecR domain-containing protein [Chitinophaga sp.]